MPADPDADADSRGHAGAQHRHRGVRAVQRLLEHAPSSGGLALWMAHRDRPEDGADGASGAPASRPAPVWTDGHTVFYGAAFERLALDEQTGWVAHQVLHVALRHVARGAELRQRLGEVDLELFNLCADAIVNSALAHLRWLRLPAGAVMLEAVLFKVLGLSQPAEVALLEWDVERLYRAVDDRRPAGRRGLRLPMSRPGAGTGAPAAAAAGGTGTGLPQAAPRSAAAGQAGAVAHEHGPGTAALEDGPRAASLRRLGAGNLLDLQVPRDAADAPEVEAEHAREWSERLLRAHAGDGAHSMLRGLLADLPGLRTPWEQVLRTQLARALSKRPGLSWSRPARSYLANQGRCGPHRRMPWEPGTTASRAVPRLVLVVDVSGSIDGAMLARFASEIEAITRRLEAALVLVIGDLAVQRVQRFEPGATAGSGSAGLAGLTFRGGGGTDFTPLLEEAERHQPDLIVVLTDLDGPARHRPRRPVLWVVPAGCAAAVAPFGRLLVLR